VCDDFDGPVRSLIRRDMSANEQVVVVVDGYSQYSDGSYSLDINWTAPQCTETACTDGLDDDRDGLFDCADPDCAFNVSCYESSCSDSVDNDGDGATDCDDTECFADAACAGLCPNVDLGTVTGDGLLAGDNTGIVDDFPSSPGCGSTISSGEDAAASWQAPQDGCYVFDTEDSNYNTILRLYDACGGTELACDDYSGAGSQSLLRREMAAGEQVVVVVDGYSQYSDGNYVLDINRTGPQCWETDCADGLDDDEDGAVDCADPDCALATNCYESSCTDGVDNEGDGATDCDDGECFADAACAGLCPNADLGTATGDGLVSGANKGTGDTFPSSAGCGSGASSGEDAAVSWQAPVTGCYVFDTDDANYDTVLRIYDTCGGTEIACDDEGGVGSRSLIRRDMVAGEQVVVVVDGYASYSDGDYSLDINFVSAACTETVCDDGLDDDGDGNVDCADADCTGDAACP
jgi:hypothetical protein